MKKIEHYDPAGRHIRTEWVKDDISPTTGAVFSPIGESVAAVIAYLESAPDGEKKRIGDIEEANGRRKTILKAAFGKTYLPTEEIEDDSIQQNNGDVTSMVNAGIDE